MSSQLLVRLALSHNGAPVVASDPQAPRVECVGGIPGEGALVSVVSAHRASQRSGACQLLGRAAVACGHHGTAEHPEGDHNALKEPGYHHARHCPSPGGNARVASRPRTSFVELRGVLPSWPSALMAPGSLQLHVPPSSASEDAACSFPLEFRV